ncbi:hypothetical protein [Pelagicoccus mobilis]|uniref:Uncharacterized protein n=1 Tax=Pelagicoccus mobilis TaxID=415221 RepID=A0A934VSJ1_9BACT|nr:hypothetical protein [Pelagicoccus mobilis]MBK1880477.1 hypothetical protein [Pelagicoccus mobilis]
MRKRFFSDDSFWNQALPADVVVDPASQRYLSFLEKSHDLEGFHVNGNNYTIPVYEAAPDTPLVKVERRIKDHVGEGRFMYQLSKYVVDSVADHPCGHDASFVDGVPIPEDALPDALTDGHLSIVDPSRNRVWDMWGAERRPDGSWWCCSGISYPIDGTGVFDASEWGMRNGESVHMYGPCRAAGVPNVAGLIRYEELQAGRIEHKLAFATRYAGLQAHSFPASWTDGGVLGGPPEGITIQLDPDVDLDAYGLSPAGMAIATALKEYGAVLVDVALGSVLYAEGLTGHADKSWEGLLIEDELARIPFSNYRFLQPEAVVERGMIPGIHPIIWQTFHEAFGMHQEGDLGEGNSIVGWRKDWHAQLLSQFKSKSSQ